MRIRLVLLLSASLTIMGAPLASAKDVDTSKCNAVLEIAQYYTAEAVAWKFEGDEAHKIIGAITDALGPMPMKKDPPTIVWIGLTDQHSSDVFFYDAQGCFVNYSPNWAQADVMSLLDAVGIVAPFGRTYHQIPDAVGSRPGFSI